MFSIVTFLLFRKQIFLRLFQSGKIQALQHIYIFRSFRFPICGFFLQFEILFMKALPCLSVRTFKACAGAIRGWIRTLIRRI